MDTDNRELERELNRFGRIRNIDFKSGFCFVEYDRERDAMDCIEALNGKSLRSKGRPLRVEFAKGDGRSRIGPSSRPPIGGEPNTKLFVAGFDLQTRQRDIEDLFERFGRLRSCYMKNSFAFVEFDHIQDAKEALQRMSGKSIRGKELTVQYAKTQEPHSRRDRVDHQRAPLRASFGSGTARGRDRSRSLDRSRKENDSQGWGRSRRRDERGESPPMPRRGRSLTPRREPVGRPYSSQRSRQSDRYRERSPLLDDSMEGPKPDEDRRFSSRSPPRSPSPMA